MPPTLLPPSKARPKPLPPTWRRTPPTLPKMLRTPPKRLPTRPWSNYCPAAIKAKRHLCKTGKPLDSSGFFHIPPGRTGGPFPEKDTPMKITPMKIKTALLASACVFALAACQDRHRRAARRRRRSFAGAGRRLRY